MIDEQKDFHIWSIVGNRYVFTLYRPSSAIAAPNYWYYETMIWEFDPATKKLGGILHVVSAGNVERARKVHWQITESLLKKEREP